METYQYTPLSISSSIRLIQFTVSQPPNSDILNIELFEAPLDGSVAFEALSYTWGSPNDIDQINIRSQSLQVTSNLRAFLEQLQARDLGSGQVHTYWADQICINQADIPERNRQVAMMADIYRRSCKTLVWLGHADSTEEPALVLLKAIENLGFTKETSLSVALPKVGQVIEAHLNKEDELGNMTYSKITSLMDRPWFTRAWIVQEVALATECTVHISANVFRWETFDLACIGLAWVEKRARGILFGSSAVKTKAIAVIRHIQYCRNHWISRNAERQRGDFLRVLGRLSPTMECSDPRDRIFAFLSLQENPGVLEADYGLSVAEVFLKTSAAIAASSGSLDIFGYTRFPPLRPWSDGPTIPSWAIDWSAPSTMSRLAINIESSFCAARDFRYIYASSTLLSRIMTVHGKVVDEIGASFRGHEFPRTSDTKTLMESIRRSPVLEMALNLHVRQNVPVNTSSYDSLYHRAVKALLCYDRILDNAGEDWEESLESSLRILEQSQEIRERVPEDAASFTKFARMTSRKSIRSLYLTRQRKLLGLAPPLSNDGDLVCIIHGSKTPVILRRSNTPGRYNVIGQSYLESWMHGDSITWKEHEADKFELE